MTDTFKTIFELDAQGNQLLQELDAVKQRYTGITSEARKQEEQLAQLLVLEKQLIDARKKSSSPNEAVKYTQKIDETKKKIEALNNELKNTVKQNEQVRTSAQRSGDQINKAFEVAAIQAAKKQVQDIGTELRKTGETGEDTGEKNVNAFSRLRAEIKAAKGELVEALGTGNQELILKAQEKVGRLTDEFRDLNETSGQFASGTKFQTIGNLFRDIPIKVLEGDFARANQQSKNLLAVSKTITFAEAAKGVGDLGSTLINVGKALLVNPIFLIGAAVIAIIANFDKLKNSGGLIGKAFRLLGEIIEGLKDAFLALTDAIGLTNAALEKSVRKNIEYYQKLLDLENQYTDYVKRVREALGKSNFKLQETQLNNQRRITSLQIAELERLKKANDFLSEEDTKRLEELKRKEEDLVADLTVMYAEMKKKRQDAIRSLTTDILLNSLKSVQFDVDFKLKPGTQNQIKKQFDIQRAEVSRSQKLEIEEANIQFEDFARRQEIISLIRKKYGAQFALLKKQETKAVIDASYEQAKIELDLAKQVADSKQNVEEARLEFTKTLRDNELQQFAASIQGEVLPVSQITEKKLDLEKEYYSKKIKLAEADVQTQIGFHEKTIALALADIEARKNAGLDTTNQERELARLKAEFTEDEAKRQIDLKNLKVQLATEAAVKEKEIRDQKLKEEIDEIDSEEERQQTRLKLLNARQSTLLKEELLFEKAKLKLLKESGKEYTEEYKDQLDKVALLTQESKKKEAQEYIQYTETILNAVNSAANQAIATKISETDKLTELQQKRVDEAKNIADQGNAELLELEQQRLDALNKQKANFVRQQQALASVELVANTAIAVSKAAAEGGAGAAFTIAAALIALVAGLASARSIASQAAFYKGGEFEGSGYTGDGIATDESTTIGRKPYTYHKREFIFNHEKTDQNLDIFRRVHKGAINLREWEAKVKAYDNFNLNRNADVFMKPALIENTSHYRALESKLDAVVSAIHSQPGMKLTLTREGIHAVVTEYQGRQDLIKKLAK
jgi:hypothetical protein